jgi:cell division protein FtsQ
VRWVNAHNSGQTRFPRGAKRPRVIPLWRRTEALAGAVMVVSAAAMWGSMWLWQHGWVERVADDAKWQVIAAGAHAGFKVREIYVDGRQRTDREALVAALRLERGAPILAFDPEAARRRVEALPWVRSAVVERRLPDVVALTLVERRPMALWQQDGRFALIDTDGEVILHKHLEPFGRLPVVIGDDAPRHTAALLNMLATRPALAKRVRAAVRIGRRRWDLHLDNLVAVRLPETGAADAWMRLAELDRDYGILERKLDVVDLRLPDRIVVQPASMPAVAPSATARDT